MDQQQQQQQQTKRKCDDEDHKIFQNVVEMVVKRKKREFKSELDEINRQRRLLGEDKKKIRTETANLAKIRDEERNGLTEVLRTIEQERKEMRIESVQMDEVRAKNAQERSSMDAMHKAIDDEHKAIAEEYKVIEQMKNDLLAERNAIDEFRKSVKNSLEHERKANIEQSKQEQKQIVEALRVLELDRKKLADERSKLEKGKSICQQLSKELKGCFSGSDVDFVAEPDAFWEIGFLSDNEEVS